MTSAIGFQKVVDIISDYVAYDVSHWKYVLLWRGPIVNIQMDTDEDSESTEHRSSFILHDMPSISRITIAGATSRRLGNRWGKTGAMSSSKQKSLCSMSVGCKLQENKQIRTYLRPYPSPPYTTDEVRHNAAVDEGIKAYWKIQQEWATRKKFGRRKCK